MELRFSPGNQPESDSGLVSDTAGLLEITEFRLFQLAYHDWYGTDINDQETETYFIPFMFNEVVPFWLRHFCETIQKKYKQGVLNREELGIKPDPYPKFFLRWFVTSVTVLVVVLTVLVFLAETAMEFFDGCYFPPCF